MSEHIETRTKYLVELETGIGFSNRGGYAVFTGHRWCKTKSEAIAVANELCRDKPLFQVRITREFRRREVVMTFVPLKAFIPHNKVIGGENQGGAT